MNFYIVSYPDKKPRIFQELRDAKNCISNLGPVHKGVIKCYKGENVGNIVWLVQNWEKKWLHGV